jgi:hypothetical protein
MRTILKKWWFNIVVLFYFMDEKIYLVNHSTKEIHDLIKEHHNCFAWQIKNREFVNFNQAKKLIETEEYNGCRWCWPEKNTG